MPAAWQASGTLLGSTGADITPVWPTHVADDIGILTASSRVVTDTLLTPSGWTLLHGPVDVTTIWRSYVFWIRATGGAMTNPLLDWTGAGEKYGQVHTVRGAITTGSPFAASAFTGDATDPLTHTGVTTTVDDQLVIVVCIANDNLSTTVTVTSVNAPTTFTLNNYQDIATGNDAEGHFASARRATAGATGTVTNDFDAAMPAGCALVAAVLDAPVAVPPQRHMAPMLPHGRRP